MTGAATPAIAALLAAQVPHQVLRYHHDPRRRRCGAERGGGTAHGAGRHSFGAEAVEQLAGAPGGLVAGQVYKTLVLALVRETPAGLGVAVLPVPAKLSLKAAAAALGAARATMADPATAERSTGYVVGGISPFGQRKPLPTVVDASALGWDQVVCSAGRRGWDVAVAPQDLIRLTHAVTADISAA